MNEITIIGKIEFEPTNVTNKHNAQASWKRIAMVMIDGDICEYYAWFIKKRYSLVLNKPLRGPHISFINDSNRDLGEFGMAQWDTVKNKWNGKEIEIIISTDVRSDARHWWMNIPNGHRALLHGIRAELGLGRPYFGLHLSLGYANEKFIDHCIYIHTLIEKGLITT